jgi:hypothetical protein
MIKQLNTAALAKIIAENPGCVLHVDNDSWKLTRASADDNPHDYDDDESSYEAWAAANKLASYRDIADAACSAGDVLEALALLAKVTVEYA